MRRRLTITLDSDVYDGLCRVVGRGKISAFIENLVRPHLVPEPEKESWAALAQYERETGQDIEALERADALIGDVADEAD